ncbi:MAG: Txe/YoeB family addiction module toxin [Actinomycetes bacterium]|jgi:toxin YoeB|nr:Txe/YoeB family addiction module toxin [Actinomycetes bacterium]
MPIIFSDDAWRQYVLWQSRDKKTLRKINRLLADIDRNGHRGIGKTEQLRHNLSGLWSKRIDEKNRLIYRINGEGVLEVVSCEGHYDE